MNDFVEFYDVEYGPKLGIRAPTFRAVLREALHRKAMTIVETGCIRKLDNWEGDGQSTIIWSAYKRFLAPFGAKFITIDTDEAAIETVHQQCREATTYCGDSVKVLSKMEGSIDLLYLDSFDLDVKNEQPAALHCLMELTAAMPRLHSGSIVFVDDSPMAEGWIVTGKGRFVAEYMRHLGVNPFTFGYQTAWLMP